MRPLIISVLICLLLTCCAEHGSNTGGASQASQVKTTTDTLAIHKPDALDSAAGCWKLVYIFFGNDRYRDMEARKIDPDEWALIQNHFIRINPAGKLHVSDTLVPSSEPVSFHNYHLGSRPEIMVNFNKSLDTLCYHKEGKGDEEWSFTYKRCDTAICKQPATKKVNYTSTEPE